MLLHPFRTIEMNTRGSYIGAVGSDPPTLITVLHELGVELNEVKHTKFLVVVVGVAAVGCVFLFGCNSQPVNTASLAATTQAVQTLQCSYVIGADSDGPTAIFSIVNESNTEWVLTKKLTSCNCFSAELSKSTIPPRGTAQLSLYINEPDLRSPSTKTLKCILEFGSDSRLACISECVVYPFAEWSDGDLDVGIIKSHDTFMHKIPVVVFTRDKVAPDINLSSNSDECHIETPSLPFTHSQEVPESPGVWLHRGSIGCSIKPVVDTQSGGALIKMQATNGESRGSESLSLSWSTASDYSFHPRMLVLRGVSSDPRLMGDVTIHREGGTTPLQVDRIEYPYKNILHVADHIISDTGNLRLTMSLKAPCEGVPLYGDILTYIKGHSRPLSIPFVVVP
jgi:hypothetical protein